MQISREIYKAFMKTVQVIEHIKPMSCNPVIMLHKRKEDVIKLYKCYIFL